MVQNARKAYNDGLIDLGADDWKHLEQDAKTPPEMKRESTRRRFKLLDDPVTEMAWWAAFHRNEPRGRAASVGVIPDLPLPPSTKYKKCCLGKD